MSSRQPMLGRYHVLRRLGGDDDAPLLVRDASDPSARFVLRAITPASVSSARRFAGASHPRLARCVGVQGSAVDGWFLVSEFVEGVDLGVARPELSRRHALTVLRDAVVGLEALHRIGLTHGDFKPSNIIVDDHGRGRLIDPRLVGDPRGEQGTLHYLAPERLVSGVVDPAADLFAVGVVLFEILAGHVPFRGESALEVVRSIMRGAPTTGSVGDNDPLRVAGLAFSKALLAREPSLRPTAASAVLVGLDAVLRAERGLPANEESTPDRSAEDLAIAVAAARPVFVDSDQRQLEDFLDRLHGVEDERLDRVSPHREVQRLLVRGVVGSGRTAFLRYAEERAIARGMVFVRLSGGEQGGRTTETLAAALRSLLGDAPETGPTSAEALGELIARTSRQTPLLLISDDHDLGSFDRRAWVRELLQPPNTLPQGRLPSIGVGKPSALRDDASRVGVLVSGSGGRVEVLLPLDSIQEGESLDVSTLTEREVLQWLTEAFSGLAAPEALASELVRRSAGLPGRVRGMLRRLLAMGGIEEQGGVTVADLAKLRRVADLGDEGGSTGALDASWSTLTDPQRTMIAAVAVANEPLSVATLAVGLNRPATSVGADVRSLVRENLLREEGSGSDGVSRYQLEWGVPRDEVVDRREVDAETWTSLTRVVLSEPFGEFAKARAAGRFLQQAGRPAAARFLIRAARLAGPAEALRLLEDAERLRPRGSTDPKNLALRARSANASGDQELAREWLVAARDASDDPSDRRRLSVELAQLLARMDRSSDALDILDQQLRNEDPEDARSLSAAKSWLLHVGGQDDDAAPVLDRLASLRPGAPEDDLEVAAVLAAVFDRQGRRRDARIQAVRARRLARRLGRLSRAAFFDSMLAMRDAESGRLSLGMTRVSRAVRMLEQAEDRRLLPDVLTRLGFLRLRSSDPVGAMRAFGRARGLFDAASALWGRGWAANGEGEASLDLGDPIAAAAHFEQSVEDRAAAGSFQGAALSAVNLVRARSRSGDQPAMRRAVRAARERIRAPGAESVIAHLLLALARDAGDRGRRRRFCRMIDLAAGAVERFDSREHAIPILLMQSESRLLLGEGEEAVRHARRARFLARDANDLPSLGRATALRAAGLLVAGRLASARHAFRAAAILSNEPAAAAYARFVYARAAMVALRRGDASEARSAAALATEAAATYAARGNVPCEEASNDLATALSAAVRRTETPLDVRRRMDALRAALEASRWINEGTEVSDVLDRILDAGLRLSGAARGFLVVKDKGGALRFEAARARGGQDLVDPEEQISRGIVDDVVIRGRTVVTSEARVDERFREYQSISSLELLSVLCAPLKTPTKVVGALYIDDQARIDRFDEVTREVVEALAEHAAIALEKARLLAEVEGLNARLREDVVTRTRERDRARDDLATVRDELAERYTARHIISEDPRMLDLFALVERVADADAPVLIEGEPGTGKELIARALHFSSRRRSGQFVAINCASLPDALVEAELFGYQRGAFTGALADREGLLAAADGGTLFLDEIGEMQPAIQAKLLRVLQDGEYVRLGDTVPRQTRARVVSATNRSLLQMTAQGTFREDLYWRLKVLRVEVPPLRERRKDIRLLIRHFASRLSEKDGGKIRGFTEASLRLLESKRWPGNVRELESMVRALLLTTDCDPVDVVDLPADLLGEAHAAAEGSAIRPPEATDAEGGVVKLKERMEELEREMVRDALDRNEDNRSHAAEALGITRRWLLKLIDKHGL